MEFSYVEHCYVDPDSITEKDFYKILKYCYNTFTLEPKYREFVKLLCDIYEIAPEEASAENATYQFDVVYKSRVLRNNFFTASLIKIGYNTRADTLWFYLLDDYNVSLEIRNVFCSSTNTVVATVTIMEDSIIHLSLDDFKNIFQENGDNDEETGSDDGGSGSGEVLPDQDVVR